MNRSKGKKLTFVGARILANDDEAAKLKRAFLGASSSNSKRLYSRPSELTESFDVTPKKKKEKEEKDLTPEEIENRYGNDGHIEYSTNDYEQEMDRILAYDAYQYKGCNHRNDCPLECCVFHDYASTPRNHYYYLDGTTTYERCRYGRFVRDPTAKGTALIRLSDDPEDEEINYPRDSLYKKGWHHEDHCSLDCSYYHYHGSPPDRFTRTGGIFVSNQSGRWLRDYVNGDLSYIRIGPNDDYENDEERGLPKPRETKIERKSEQKKEKPVSESSKIDAIRLAFREKQYKAAKVSLLFEKPEFSNLIEFILSTDTEMKQKTAIPLIQSEIDRFLESIRSYYRQMFVDFPLFKVEMKDNTELPLIKFRVLPPTESLNSLYSRYPYMKEFALTQPEVITTLTFCVDNKLPIPLLVLSHEKYAVMRFHIISTNRTPKIVAPKKRFKEMSVESSSKEEESLSESHEKPRKKLKKSDDSEISHETMDSHEWKKMDNLSTRQHAIYSCECSLKEGIHYRRACSSKECVGDGFVLRKTRGYCSACKKTNK